jgi:flagellar biosynthetic protein FlhB
MAENQDRSREDLTEDASPYRLEEARRKGQVAQSKEISGLLALLATGVTAYAMAPSIAGHLSEFMREVFQTDLSSRVDLTKPHIAGLFLTKAMKLMLLLGAPICLAGFAFGAIGSFAQIGSIFSTEPLQPDLDKINPLKGLQKFLTFKQLLDGLRMILKMAVISAVAYGLVKTEVINAPAQITGEAGTLLAAYGHAAKVMFLALCGVLLVFAAIDFGLTKWDFMQNMKMTKQEARQEFKEREGDPQIKARIRAVQREVARRRMMQAVRKADVIVTNPTHIAIALSYDKEKMAAPKVVAKGADHMAQKIKQIAAEAGVPMVENVPLARTLFKTVKVNQSIPRALYQAVAEVLAYVYRLKGNTKGFS